MRGRELGKTIFVELIETFCVGLVALLFPSFIVRSLQKIIFYFLIWLLVLTCAPC